MISYLYLVSTIIFKRCDVMYAYINNPQQRIYTIARLE
jgi:hypothetical protein